MYFTQIIAAARIWATGEAVILFLLYNSCPVLECGRGELVNGLQHFETIMYIQEKRVGREFTSRNMFTVDET